MDSSADPVSALRRAICVGFANRLARRLPKHNGFRTFNSSSVVAEVHPSSARQLADDNTGLLPEWLVYHELVATSRPFLRNVCRVEEAWLAPLMPRLTGVDVRRLSGGVLAGGKHEAAVAARAKEEERTTAAARETVVRKNDDKAVDDARARFLARKQKQAKKTKP